MADMIDDLDCAMCMSLMVDPTTLMCGHSFCRYCLAKWCATSGKRECAQCCRRWSETPSVNIALRNLIEAKFPEDYALRHNSVPADYDQCLQIFEKSVHRIQESKAVSVSVSWKFASVIVAVVSWWLFKWLMLCSDSELLTQKPLLRWTSDDVDSWVSSIELWPKGSNITSVLEAQRINGLLLSAIEEDALDEILPDASDLQRRAFWISLSRLKAHGMKMPSTVWEFKATYPVMTATIVHFVADTPRTLFVLLYLHYHEDAFVPAANALTPHNTSAGGGTVLDMYHPLSWNQLFATWIMIVLSPFLAVDLILRNALCSSRFFFCSLFMAACYILALKEYQYLFRQRHFLMSFFNWKRCLAALLDYGIRLLWAHVMLLVIYVLYLILPQFIFTFLIYARLATVFMYAFKLRLPLF